MDGTILLSCYIMSSFILLLSSAIHSLELFAVKSSFNDLIYFKSSKSSNLQLINLYHPNIKNGFHLVLAILSLVAAGLLIVQPLSLLYKIIFLGITLLYFYSYEKRNIGKGGADQVRILAFLSFSLCFLASGHFVQSLPLFFMGVQLLLAYSTSGLAKLFSASWRKGHVLADILNTNSYGTKSFASYLKTHPRVEKFCSHSAIVAMLLVPVAFCIPIPELFYLSLLGMLCFHIATAILMGLNDFLYTFPLTYPAVYYLYHAFHHFLQA